MVNTDAKAILAVVLELMALSIPLLDLVEMHLDLTRLLDCDWMLLIADLSCLVDFEGFTCSFWVYVLHQPAAGY